MSLSGTTNTYLPPTLDGLNIIDADAIYINGIPIDTENLVPYTNATKNVNLGTFNFQTLGSVSAKEHLFPSFGSTMMTGPMTSSIFTADAWLMNNTLAISSLGGGSFVSTSYLRMTDGSNNSTLLTLQSDGIADFANTKVRVSTMATSAYDVVNLSTLTSAVAFIENVNALNYVPYTGATNDLNMGASTITTTGYVSTSYLTLSESTNSEAWTLYTLSTMGNLSTLGGLVIQETTSGNSVYLTGGVVGAKNFQFSSPGGVNAGKVVCTDGNSVMSTTISAGQLQYINALHSNAGGVGETNTWSNTQTFSVAPTLNSLTTTTPSFSLGIDGSNQVIKFTPAVSGGTVNTSTTTARFLPYLSTATTLTNSLLNQIDNDSMGFGYTAIPSYPLGSGGKNMYINGSIFAGALNSMYATFGRDTNTSNPANEITFTANGAGVLVSQIKSHSGSSAFYDATWTYSNTNPAPLGANQGQVLLTADKMTMSLTNGLFLNGDFRKVGGASGTNYFGIRGTDPLNSPYLEFFTANVRRSYIGYATATSMNVFTENGANLQLGTEGITRMTINTAGDVLTSAPKFIATGTIGNINGGSNYAVNAGYMSAGSLTLGDTTKNYGGGTTLWNSNTAGLLMECAINTEIAIHDAGDRVASFMYYAGNVFTMGRDMGYGKSDVSVSRNISVIGALKLPGLSDQEIYNGQVDAYNPTGNNNLMIRSWWGIGFSSYDGGVRIAMDTRSGNASYQGDITARGFTPGSSRFIYSPETAGATYGSICVKGSGRNGWAGYSIYNDANQQVSFMMQNGGQLYGLYNATTTRWNFLLDGAGDVIILNSENSRGFRTHNALTSNVIYNATPTTASNIGTWNGFGYTLLSNTQTPAGNAPCLGFGCNYSNTGQITCLQPGVAWMNLAIFNAQTTFTYFGVACGYTVPSGGANVSDVREKHCISNVCTKNSLRKIMCLKPKYYKRKYYDEGTDEQGNPKTKVPDEVKDAMCIGVMAQDLLDSPLAPTVTVAPTKSDGACGDDDGTRYGVNYGDINIHLIGAVQELKKQNDAQQEQIEDLRAYKSLSEERFEKMGRLIGDQQKLLEFLMAKLK
jgi:hypothetical protein